MTLIRIGYAFRIRVNEQEKIVYDKLFQHHLSRGQATATQTTWPGLLLCSSCWPLTGSLRKGCLNCIPRTSPVQSSHNSNALSAHCYVPCLQTHLCNKQAFSSLRWEKDKDNTAAEQKSSFWGLLPWGSISLCHRKLKLQQVLPGSSSKPLSANTAIPAYMTCILFSVHPTNTKTFCLFTQRMRSPCSLDQQIRLNKLQGKRTKLYLPFKTI